MERRILILAPTGQDAPLAAQVLALAMIQGHVCQSAAELAAQLELGAAGVLAADEALPAGAFAVLGEYIARQPAWSDLPIILLTARGGSDSPRVRQAVAGLGNLTLLERPVNTLTLVASAHALLRARTRQYQAREAERRKDEFLASLGHELRNPLAPIKTSVALLGQLYPDVAAVQRIKDVIDRQVTHLTRLVDDLLDVARITSGKIALRRERVLFGAVLDHVKELCLQNAANKHIRIDFALPPHDVALHADAARVVQILANIVSNAIKFTPVDGRIAVRAWLDAGQLSISVKDNGVGLKAEAIPRIFSMFEQSQTVSGQMASGLGIGLSLARKFAEMHGGSVQASSEGPGKGSEFVIRLPVAAAETAAPAAPPDAAPAAAQPTRVLVVDDNRDAADSLQALFQMAGYDVATAYDGQAALAAVQAGMPQLIVMDLGMPGMDGYETARRIRQLPRAGRIMMIALTGWGQGDARSRTLEAGFDFHLIKPVDFADIVALAGAAPQPPAP
ncbi:response regulator [Janthinobacterium fluminis]|uniref:histidine kinase n=1 Tax=Janthinobacterium fluminis TaxID=2987524 RepID=A0ABT5K2F5_9BURK|nr:response regulator [Janthinobacterium fluminis]MDC8759059.1 response regulator [Janthinobacterium fluminis]